jgi:hypothetical protein
MVSHWRCSSVRKGLCPIFCLIWWYLLIEIPGRV